MSNGRLDLGVGPGVSPYELGYYGVGEEKQAVYRETVDLLVKGLTSDTLTHHGDHHSFDDVPMILKTVQKPMPPMWAGVGSEDGMVFAAKHGINAIGLGPSGRIAQIVKFYRQAWDEQSKDPMRAFSPTKQPKVGALRQIHIADTDEQAWAEAGPAYKHWFGSLNWLWEQHGDNASKFLLGDLQNGVDLGAVIVGSPDTVRKAMIKERHMTGYNYAVLQFAFGTLSNAQVKQALALFEKEVMPALQG
jgi:alkanesulfonate monooxygenase SsuD/methylene tetrahydromethanopterin reductase-like flavin-dependent oxidoreductase (luciferase family)